MEATDWKSAKIHMIDFEGSASSGVVEYGVVTLCQGEISAVETRLCRPTGLIRSRDRDVHGIDQKDAVGHAPFAEDYERFVELRRDGVFAAHNRHAENTFIKSTWALPPAVPDWRGGSEAAQEWGPWVDTLSLYKAVYPGLESYGLGDLVAQFGLQDQLNDVSLKHCPGARRKPHCALYDALASSLLLLQLEATGELRDRITLSWLLQLSQGMDSQQELF
jgi:DNA polymerase-3 subunit epsilon